jgi:sulfonate transport system substrate-binding protein
MLNQFLRFPSKNLSLTPVSWAAFLRSPAFLICVLSILTSGHGTAADLPEAVRIAAVAYPNAGSTVFIGAQPIIEEQGWLEQELGKKGIALKWIPAPHTNVGPVINESFANRSIDFAAYGDLPSILLNAGGVDTRLVFSNGIGSDAFLVVPAGSSAKSITDLKGKRIAIHRGRPWELPFVKLLEANGLKYGDFKIFNINPLAGAAALSAGKVDALFTLTDAYLLEDRGTGRIIWSTKEAPPDWKMRMGLWASKSFVEKYPEITQIVVTSYIKAAYWTAQDVNRDEFIRISARSGTPESTIRREYEGDTVSWKDRWSPLFDAYQALHYQNAVAYALEKKLIPKKIDSDQLLEPKFVEAGLRDLQLEGYWTAPKANEHEDRVQ